MPADLSRGWRFPSSQIPETLQDALQWMELDLRHPYVRAARYCQLTTEYIQGQRSPEHFFAFTEAPGILDVYMAWKDKAEFFDGIKQKIKRVFKKGPVLTENESQASTSARNLGFGLHLAGKLLHAIGVEVVSVDGIYNRALGQNIDTGSPPDISIRYEGLPINIECKRPLTLRSLQANAEEALEQINNEAREIRNGIIAIDLSRCIRESYHHFEAPTNDQASEALINQLQDKLLPVAHHSVFAGENLLGFIGYIRVPYVIPIESAIVRTDGEPYRDNFISTASICISIKNKNCNDGSLLRSLNERLVTTEHDVPPSSSPLGH